MPSNDLRRCDKCGLWTSNEDHICTEYSPDHPCEVCGADTVFSFIAAPGTGSGWSCKNGHYVGTYRELTLADVI